MEESDVLQQEDRMHQAIKENNLAAVEACVEERWPLDRVGHLESQIPLGHSPLTLLE